MTDSILRSYQYYSTTSIVPFPAAATGARALLGDETSGWAFDATTETSTVTVIDTGTPANNLSNVTLDASTMVQSGTSAKMVQWSSAPFVRWTPHNMFLNSGSPATQSVTVVTGLVYTVTVTGSGSLAGSSGASGTATAGAPVTFTATGTTATWTLTGSLTTIQMNRGPIATPYLVTAGSIRIGIPQTYDGAASKYAIWSEAAATNLATNSEKFSVTSSSTGGWSTSVCTVTADNTTAPDGSSTADKIEATGNGAFVYQEFTPVNLTQAVSVYLKAGTTNWAILRINNFGGADISAWFDVGTGVTGSNDDSGGYNGKFVSSSILAIGGGWYRCVLITAPYGAGVTELLIEVCHADNTTNATAGDNIYAWGAQLENNSFATSYIPTPGAATASRAIDDLTIATSTFPYSATLGTMYFDGRTADAAADQVAWELDDNTANERIFFYRTSADDPIAGIIDGGTPQDALDLGTLTSSTRVQASFAWKAADVDASLNGAAPTAGSGSETLPTMSNLQIGCDVSTTAWNSYIYRMLYVPRQVQTDAANLSTWRYNF